MAALSVGVAIILPVLEVIQKAGEAVRASSTFMLSFIPVFAGITTAAGQPVTASLYQGLLFGVAQVVSSAANTIVVPLLSLFLAFSLVSAVAVAAVPAGEENAENVPVKVDTFSFQISEYTQEELTRKAHNYELERSPHTVLCLDYAQSGIGSNSCGPQLAKPMRFDEETFTFRFDLVVE